MKNLVLIASLSWLGLSAFAQQKAIEVEPRAGFSFQSSSRYSSDSRSGFNVGVLTSFQVNNRFYSSPGISCVGLNNHSYKNTYCVIPVYATYKLPVKKVVWDFNVGPHGQLGADCDMGISAEVGAAYQHWHLAVNTFQNIIKDTDRFFGISLGYRFHLR